jgi:hypothetical protein
MEGYYNPDETTVRTRYRMTTVLCQLCHFSTWKRNYF